MPHQPEARGNSQGTSQDNQPGIEAHRPGTDSRDANKDPFATARSTDQQTVLDEICPSVPAAQWRMYICIYGKTDCREERQTTLYAFPLGGEVPQKGNMFTETPEGSGRRSSAFPEKPSLSDGPES